jgi:predicted 3-demethylubiquinone-9 3-methyltransferase (glyoxalase superfamily)
MSKVTPFLTFKENGEQAVKLYTSLIKNSEIFNLVRSEGGGPFPQGALQHASFQLDGQNFMAMDGGPYFGFDQGFSLFVSCETQEEIDKLWYALSEGGEEGQCGWLKDRFGVSWQIIPSVLGDMLMNGGPEKSQRVTEAFLKMTKFDIQALQEAYAG